VKLLLHRKRQIRTDFVKIKGDYLTNLANEHLDQDRLERLAKALADEVMEGTASPSAFDLPPRSSANAPDPPARARQLAGDRAHADYCPGCRASVETLVEAEMRFRQMISSVAVPFGVRTAECPADQIWARLATGLIPDREATPWIWHAAKCGFCGALLRKATEDLALEATPGELTKIQELVTPARRGKMARAMSEAATGAQTSGDGSAAARPGGGWRDWLRRRVR